MDCNPGMNLGLAGTHPFYKEKIFYDYCGFLQAPTPQQQIQCFTDEAIAWEIILRTIEKKNSGCVFKHPQTSSGTTQENSAFGSTLLDCANLLCRDPSTWLRVCSQAKPEKCLGTLQQRI